MGGSRAEVRTAGSYKYFHFTRVEFLKFREAASLALSELQTRNLSLHKDARILIEVSGPPSPAGNLVDVRVLLHDD